MPRDNHDPATTSTDHQAKRRPRALPILLGIAALLVLGVFADRTISIRPGATQRIIVSRGGEVVALYGPGQHGFANPWTDTRAVVEMSLSNTDRSAPDRGMPALTAEGLPVTLYGTAFWHHGEEADLRWRFSHIRGDADLMPPLMAASVAAVLGRTPMEAAIRDAAALQAALTDDLRARARALLRIEVASFAITRLDPGETYRQVVAERELGRARAAAIAASPAVTGDNPNAVEVERIRRWDGRGVIPELPARAAP
ncbi:hypothetical protein D9599_00810 [Roseomonas sp. KE2513]|uniref:SPFH domain-containing protein n=1 Tax=Roseomonas sp. KE2513 TaxID=2479202 RepID=UPI0018E05DAB|nr:SPFH domain-containing protein [Roseomonas sp. KE2513]MBI0534115.1 hypothetical protein [Roseomonas sp. KE2513]